MSHQPPYDPFPPKLRGGVNMHALASNDINGFGFNPPIRTLRAFFFTPMKPIVQLNTYTDNFAGSRPDVYFRREQNTVVLHALRNTIRMR